MDYLGKILTEFDKIVMAAIYTLILVRTFFPEISFQFQLISVKKCLTGFASADHLPNTEPLGRNIFVYDQTFRVRLAPVSIYTFILLR